MKRSHKHILSAPSLLLGGLFSLFLGWSATATAEVTDSTTPETVLATDNKVVNDNAIKTQTCPEAFYQVKLPINGKLCQVFAADLPASMIFHVPQSPDEVVEYYKQSNSIFNTTKQVKDRYLMQSSDKNTTIIISSDGSGTQVDVLVKNEQS
jgi:hypothetical protein